MPKLKHVSPSIVSLLYLINIALCLVLLQGGNIIFGQTPDSPRNPLPDKLPDTLNDDWRAISSSQILTAEQTSVLPDGDVYKEYGLESLTNRHYSNGKTKIAIEVFRMKFASGAYGLHTFNRNNLNDSRLEFRIGRHLVSISVQSGKTPSYEHLIRFLQTRFVGDGELSPLPSHLPKQDKISDSEKYIIGPTALSRIKEFANLKDVISFDGGTEAAIAEYKNADGRLSLIIVEYHTPQLATDGYNQFQSYLNQLSEQDKSQKLMKRIGNYIVMAVNVKDSPAAEGLISQIKYNPRVYWEGDRLSHIPLAFRPPDPVAIEEASQTALMIIRTFYWVGIMLLFAIFLGVITGGSVFYWKRYRRRQLGLDDIFSDAGGSLRLNLESYLLQQRNTTFGNEDREKKE